MIEYNVTRKCDLCKNPIKTNTITEPYIQSSTHLCELGVPDCANHAKMECLNKKNCDKFNIHLDLYVQKQPTYGFTEDGPIWNDLCPECTIKFLNMYIDQLIANMKEEAQMEEKE